MFIRGVVVTLCLLASLCVLESIDGRATLHRQRRPASPKVRFANGIGPRTVNSMFRRPDRCQSIINTVVPEDLPQVFTTLHDRPAAWIDCLSQLTTQQLIWILSMEDAELRAKMLDRSMLNKALELITSQKDLVTFLNNAVTQHLDKLPRLLLSDKLLYSLDVASIDALSTQSSRQMEWFLLDYKFDGFEYPEATDQIIEKPVAGLAKSRTWMMVTPKRLLKVGPDARQKLLQVLFAFDATTLTLKNMAELASRYLVFERSLIYLTYRNKGRYLGTAAVLAKKFLADIITLKNPGMSTGELKGMCMARLLSDQFVRSGSDLIAAAKKKRLSGPLQLAEVYKRPIDKVATIEEFLAKFDMAFECVYETVELEVYWKFFHLQRYLGSLPDDAMAARVMALVAKATIPARLIAEFLVVAFLLGQGSTFSAVCKHYVAELPAIQDEVKSLRWVFLDDDRLRAVQAIMATKAGDT